MVESTRIKVVREESGEAEGGRGLVVLADNWLGSVRSLTATLGRRGLFIVIRNIVGN